MKALELADQLFSVSTRCDEHYSLDRSAAAELRRLSEVNAELLGALEAIIASRDDQCFKPEEFISGGELRSYWSPHASMVTSEAINKGRCAIAKAKEYQ